MNEGNANPDSQDAPANSSGLVVWFTGLSGAGKTTLATAVQQLLRARGHRAPLLDGDVLRAGLCSDLGFSAKDRHENVRRAGAVAALMADAGLVCIVALISPFRIDRDAARALVPPGRFLEIFVTAPLAVCEQRDVKGLYRRARANEIAEFTGISSPYEAPESPELIVPSDRLSVEESSALVWNAVEERLQ
jgi:adenylylsulfate kinase